MVVVAVVVVALLLLSSSLLVAAAIVIIIFFKFVIVTYTSTKLHFSTTFKAGSFLIFYLAGYMSSIYCLYYLQ